MDLNVTVCICTRNRAADLRRAIASAAASGVPVQEVVVADDGDDDQAKQVVAGATGVRVTLIEGPREGLGANRNRALQAAEGDYVLFLDDDAELGENFLSSMQYRLEAVAEEARGTTIVTGSELNNDRPVEPSEQGYLGFQSRPYGPGDEMRTVVINATLFPRALFDRVRFDSQLRYGYDEVDLTTQAVKAGFRIVENFEAQNLHHPSTSGREGQVTAAHASRLYVTYKRRRWTEGDPSRAAIGAVVAISHLWLASVRRTGLRRGSREAARCVGIALRYVREHRSRVRNQLVWHGS